MKHTARLTPIRLISCLTVLMALTFYLALPALAAMPPAGSVIGNQATATYTDASGQTKTATSNLVETTVQQVGSFSLIQDNTKTAAIGNTVYMPHTLTNSGNGSDSFELSLADLGGGFIATNIAIYLDANGDGVPDSTTPLATTIDGTFTTPSLPAGGTYSFVVSMTVPASATNGQVDAITVTATGSTLAIYDGNNDGTFGESGDNVKTNTDTLTVTTLAAFQVNKSISLSQGSTGVNLTYTLTYKNTGAAAGNLALSDVIGDGTTVGYKYIPASAMWSAGSSSLADDNGGVYSSKTVGTMTANYLAVTDTSDKTTIEATITNVGPNVTGTITFEVAVLSTASFGSGSTTNTAYFGVDTDTDPTNNTLTQPTNPSPYKVLGTYSVVLNDGTGSPTDGGNVRPGTGANDDTDPDGTGPGVADATANADLLYIPSASPGQTISFSNVVWNTGNTTDTFNITASGMTEGGGYGTWPAGTTFQLFKSDGATTLLDSNNDNIADTGPLAADASYTVVLKVTLPANASGAVGPFDVEKTATSVGNPSATPNKTYDRLGTIIANTVDLANSTGSVDAATNQDPVVAVPTTDLTDVLPNTTVVFPLFLRNEGLIADSYNLFYSGSSAFSPSIPLANGLTMEFRTNTGTACSTTGSVINSAIPVTAGAEVNVCAVVTVPAGALAVSTDIYFQAKSQLTGAFDVKFDRVTVKEVNSLSLLPNNTGQIYPGGTVVYAHTLSNTGNTSCGPDYNFDITESLAAQGWVYVLYRDFNGNGIIDATDTVIDQSADPDLSATLAAGVQVKILVKVFAPAGAASGSTDVVNITVSTTCGTAVTTYTNNNTPATDTTTVVTGQVRLEKTQTIDADCDGNTTADPAFTANPLTAKPGDCIIYKITATNEGLMNVVALKIEDSLPAFTSQLIASPTPTCVVPGTTSATGTYSGAVFKCADLSPHITLKPAESATMTFRVKVQQ